MQFDPNRPALFSTACGLSDSYAKDKDKLFWDRLLAAKEKLVEDNKPVTRANLAAQCGVRYEIIRKWIQRHPAKRHLLKVEKIKNKGAAKKIRSPQV